MNTNYYKDYLLDDVHTWDLTDSQLKMLDACLFLIDNKCTIRCAAANCSVTKSYLHFWIHRKLPNISNELYHVVVRILKFNETKKIGGINFDKYRKHRKSTRKSN